MRRTSLALQHPPVRLAASWVAGLLVVVVLYRHLTTCARSGCQTLGGLSWFVDFLIAAGRAIDHFLMVFGWHVAAAVVSLAITSLLVMKRGRTRRSMIAAVSVSVLVVAAFDLGIRLWVSLRPSAATGDTAVAVPQDVYLSLEKLSDPKPRGHAWDGPGTVKFMDRVVVSLGGLVHSETLAVSLDGNDSYRISWMAGDETVGRVTVEPTRGEGLEVYSVTTPEEAVFLGFGSIVIEIDRGDGAYSIGHLLLDPFADGSSSSGEVPG
ncbi:MAG: hypothetical protein OQK55_08200 [Thermoanaerobaculales bacterium]|nr:hypothetical protein [Thermoanaerobaculales bacterium]